MNPTVLPLAVGKLPPAKGRTVGFIPFPRVLAPRSKFELGSTTITVTFVYTKSYYNSAIVIFLSPKQISHFRFWFYIYNWDHSINEVKFTEVVGSRKHCLSECQRVSTSSTLFSSKPMFSPFVNIFFFFH